MGGKIRSFLALPLFIFRLPLVFIGYIYKSCKYIGYSLPKQGGSYVYNRVNKTYKGVSVWYFGEDLEESDQVSFRKTSYKICDIFSMEIGSLLDNNNN